VRKQFEKKVPGKKKDKSPRSAAHVRKKILALKNRLKKTIRGKKRHLINVKETPSANKTY
jgi:hypothetical protein